MRMNVLCRNLSKISVSNSLAKESTELFLKYRFFSLKCKDVTPKSHKIETIKNIQEILNIRFRSALKIVNENDVLIDKDRCFLNENLSLLKNNSISVEKILKYPKLLGTPSLEKAIDELKVLPYPLHSTIILACLSKLKIDSLISQYNNGENKIESISKMFKVPVDTACEYLYEKSFLVTKDTKVLVEALQLMTEFGIPIEDIRRDLWIFKYSNSSIRTRIKLIQDENIEIDSKKPWMLKSPVRVIENYAQRRTDNRQILGNASLTEYLSKKLECTEDQAKYLISKMPALKTKSLRALSGIINFLYSKNFHPYHIYRVPKILVHSVETTKKRIEELEKIGVKLDTLYMLTKSQKQFTQYFEALNKAQRTI